MVCGAVKPVPHLGCRPARMDTGLCPVGDDDHLMQGLIAPELLCENRQPDPLGPAAPAAPAPAYPANTPLPEGRAVVLEVVGAELGYPTASAAGDGKRPVAGCELIEGDFSIEFHIENI